MTDTIVYIAVASGQYVFYGEIIHIIVVHMSHTEVCNLNTEQNTQRSFRDQGKRELHR